MRLHRILIFPIFFYCVPLFPQDKTLQAVRVSAVPKVDGNLDDAAWKSAPVATDFIQNFPTFGMQASVKTEVRVVYDDNAIYVGAYLYDDPSLVRKQLTPRDEEGQKDVDFFSIFFDTYSDKQNGFQFLVTSMNVQSDARLGPNLGGGFNDFGDKTWDAVWDSKVSMKQDGWVVEIMIPYISLRFPEKNLQDWGLQLLRFTRRNNESSFWSTVDPNVNGFVNQFGIYARLENIQPPLRLSFSPYISTGFRSVPDQGRTNSEWLRSGGMDVKYGINESFTLDATLIPDFGQVISDNEVNNLTPFEIQFQENRPFFTEGTEIFNKSGLFYSRRVGARPSNYFAVNALDDNDPNIEILKNPTLTQLYNAIKLSGRTRKKLGIGVFNAVTAPMKAVLRDRTTGDRFEIETEPLANYNIFVLDQALKGRSYLTFTNTNVIRDGDARDANVTALDFSFFDKSNTFNVRGTGRYSKIFTTDSYDGFNTTLRAGKVSGKVQYTLQANVESDRYDPRDLGFLASANEVVYSGNIGYFQFTPTKNFLVYNYNFTVRYGRLYNPDAYSDIQINASAFWVMKNFWDVTITAGSLPKDQHDYFVLNTPGSFVKRPPYFFMTVNGSTDSRKRLFFSYNVLGALFNAANKDYHILEFGLRYRFSNRLSMDLSTRKEAETNYIVSAGRELNGDPIVGFVDFTDVSSILSGVYHFTPRINLTLRTRHYWSRVLFNSFANVDGNGNTIARPFIPGRDQNVNIFNVDAFLTWDFRLGSRLVAGYKNWLAGDQFVNGLNNKTYLRNFGEVFRLRHANEFTVRFIYFLDYNQLRKKR
jgi:hypothetical protein